LFCQGIPGAGKTMLASIAIDHISKIFQDHDIGIAYIFCDFKDRANQTVVNLLGSILAQLLRKKVVIPSNIANLFARHLGLRTRPVADDIDELLHTEVNRHSSAYLIIDALDECDDAIRWLFVDRLRELQKFTNINLLVTSRHIPRVANEFGTATQLEIRAHEEDVRKYLQGQIFRLANCVQRNTSLQDFIINEIAKIVDGM
jgi:NACHT domain